MNPYINLLKKMNTHFEKNSLIIVNYLLKYRLSRKIISSNQLLLMSIVSSIFWSFLFFILASYYTPYSILYFISAIIGSFLGYSILHFGKKIGCLLNSSLFLTPLIWFFFSMEPPLTLFLIAGTILIINLFFVNMIWKMVWTIIFIMMFHLVSYSQNNSGPWQSDLMIARSEDGTTFTNSTVFVDSGGVPSLIMDNSGMIISAFQWFPYPRDSENWDKVAVSFSGDQGDTWTEPEPIEVNGLPEGYTRPFDPTLAIADDGRIRVYFSTGPVQNKLIDHTIKTYSAVSEDGIHYVFEEGIRFGTDDKAVIDPAVVKYEHQWHYTAPKGAPQEGAYHCVSENGLDFTRVEDIPSDLIHSWTGNLVDCGSEMRFYGCSGDGLWWVSSQDGQDWSDFQLTNIQPGGDPAVLKIAANDFLVVYVSPRSETSVEDQSRSSADHSNLLTIYPNPARLPVAVKFYLDSQRILNLIVYNILGEKVYQKKDLNFNPGWNHYSLNHPNLRSGIYFLKFFNREIKLIQKFMILD